MKYNKQILEIIENKEMTPEQQLDSLQILGYDLEDIFDICLEK